MKRIIVILISLFFSISLFSQTIENSFNCYTVVAGKLATVDGSVMVAHNEDDTGDQLLNWYIVPPLDHLESEKITTAENTVINQVKESNGYIWLELPGMPFSDSYLNDHGVVIVSDQCLSREDKPDISDGGIGFWLRRLVAERALSARNGVEIAGELIEKYGYNSSGRTYTIADAKEAWVFSAVNGKHWVAQRVKDNEVMVIPNYYTIEEIDLSDEINYLACPDLIEYALNRGWYKEGEVFNFRNVYGNSGNLVHPHNINRKWAGMNHFSEKEWQLSDDFPFSFVPSQKVSLQNMFDVLEDHYEGCNVPEHSLEDGGNPHNSKARTICCESTQYGFVAQLRDFMPKEIGSVLWIAPFRPCTQPCIPWYLGMTEVPEGYAIYECFTTAIDNHWKVPANFRESFPNHKFWNYVDYAREIDKSYSKSITKVAKEKNSTESKLLKSQSKIEKKALELYKEDKEAAKEFLTDYTFKLLKEKR